MVPMSEYFANDPECHDLLPCTLRSHRVAGLGGDVPQGRLWVESRPRRLRPCCPVRSCGSVPFAVTEWPRPLTRGYSTDAFINAYNA